MNIFWLSNNIEKNVQYHNDKHVVKMILEYAQLLSSVHYLTGSSYTPRYKLTHKNHPCAKWVRESLSNYNYLLDLAEALCKEYTFRYEKTHKTEEVIKGLRINFPPIENKGFTSPPLAMPEKYHQKDYIQAYRDYYCYEKGHIASWKKREIPNWFIKE